jgi:tetratricopeptide (TPR) repeat protein
MLAGSVVFASLRQFSRIAGAAVVFSGYAIAARGQTPVCPVIGAHDPTPAEEAYASNLYKKAEDMYIQAVVDRPGDVKLSAALTHTMLHRGEVADAAAEANKALAKEPHSAAALTAMAEVQLHQGQPWLAQETLNEATKADPCYARTHLIRSQALRIDSMYASERAEVQKAYAIDPNDPDIHHAWASTVSPAHEVEALQQSLTTMKDLDADTRKKATDSMQSMMPLLSESTQNCKVLPEISSATLRLRSTMQDGKHIDGYTLDVGLPQTSAKLQVDTAASGLYISRALADQNGLKQSPNDPPGTVHADSVHIGPLEFRDCIVGVSETPFANKSDGFIGTDVFSSYLITLDLPQSRLTLAPLPQQAGILPGDRPQAPELRDFSPVYHRQQYLLVPVMLSGKARRLFILDLGLRFSAMRSEVAHSVSNTKINFTNAVQTVSGSTLQIYRDSFDFQFANLTLDRQGHILELDPSAMDQNAGLQVAGMLGFDMLHSLTMHLDYRDGLVKLESADPSVSSGHNGETMVATVSFPGENVKPQPSCETAFPSELPITSTIEGKVTGLLDSGHMKPGKEITLKVVHEWIYDKCRLPEGSLLWGHVTASSSSKNPDNSELGLVFDQGECDGHKRPLPLRIVGLVAAPDQFVGLHNAMPLEMSGGVRDISAVAGAMNTELDENMNPGGPPNTVRPGIILGMPKLKLEPEGGPNCSAKITSLQRSIQFGVGAEFIITMQALP